MSGTRIAGKALTIFNIIAGGASITGLYITAFNGYRSWVLGILFAVTMALVSYVLFVPENPLEANVNAKLAHYRSPTGSGRITKLQDDFAIDGYSRKEIPFPYPFSAPPEVELIKLNGWVLIDAVVEQVTTQKVVVRNKRIELDPSKTANYRWIATGILLERHRD